MEDEKERCLLCPCSRLQGKVGFNFIEEQWQHLDALSSRSFQRLFRETLSVRQFTKDRASVHRFPSRKIQTISMSRRSTVNPPEFNRETTDHAVQPITPDVYG